MLEGMRPSPLPGPFSCRKGTVAPYIQLLLVVYGASTLEPPLDGNYGSREGSASWFFNSLLPLLDRCVVGIKVKVEFEAGCSTSVVSLLM